MRLLLELVQVGLESSHLGKVDSLFLRDTILLSKAFHSFELMGLPSLEDVVDLLLRETVSKV